MARELKLGLNTGYWGAGPPAGVEDAIAEAERLGFDSMWTAEAYGSDVLTPLAWWGARTERLRLGTAIVQMSARTPAATAMAAMTMDHLSGGRFILGLGVSGPQVVEGWYGQPFAKPLARTREYIAILRDIFAREGRVTAPGPHYPLPYPDGTGLGKPLKSTLHPVRETIPIFLGAEGPKNVALCGRAVRRLAGALLLADATRASTATRWPRASRATARGARSTTSRSAPRCRSSSTTTSRRPPTCCARCTPCTSAAWARAARTSTTTSRCAWATRPRPSAARTSTSTGARTRPPPRCRRRLVEELALIGPRDKIRDDLEAWRESIVTTMLVAGSPEMLRDAAELVLG